MRRSITRPFLLTVAPEGGEGGGSTTPSEGGEGGQQERTFTQADVDRIVQGRLSKFADYDDIKRQLSEQETTHQAAIEAAVAEATTAAKAAATEEVRASLVPRIVAAEIRAQAAGLGFQDPKDALSLYGDASTVTVGEDFTPDASAISTRLREIADEKAYLLGTAKPSDMELHGGLGGHATPDPLTGKSGQDLLATALEPKKN